MTFQRDPRQTGPMTVLLVEDDDGDAKAVRRAFERSRIANPVVRVRDGIEALALLRGKLGAGPQEPMFLLVDINMPRMNGLELVRALRADPHLTHHIIFVLTTSRDPQDIREAYASHVAGYIVKQDAGRDFLALVQTLGDFWTCVQKPISDPASVPG